VQIKCPKGYYRTIYAKSHPLVKTAAQLYYRGKKIENSANPQGKNLQNQCAKDRHRLGINSLTINNNTIKENNIKTTATPSPPPCKGAPALLVERDKQADAAIKHFIQNFGREKKKRKPLSPGEFEQRRAAQIKALFAIGPDRPKDNEKIRASNKMAHCHSCESRNPVKDMDSVSSTE